MLAKDVKPGMVVRLASGGPAMTVHTGGGKTVSPVTCVWFAGETLDSGHFNASNLIPGAAPPVAADKPVPAVLVGEQFRILTPDPHKRRYYWDDGKSLYAGAGWMVEESMAETEERVRREMGKEKV